MTTFLYDQFKADPKERNPKYKYIIEQAGIEADKTIEKNFPKAGLGRCHLVWGEQKRILKENHNIDWKSPSEMNKNVFFD